MSSNCWYSRRFFWCALCQREKRQWISSCTQFLHAFRATTLSAIRHDYSSSRIKVTRQKCAGEFCCVPISVLVDYLYWNQSNMLRNVSTLYRINSMQRILVNLNANHFVIQACFMSTIKQNGRITIDGISKPLKQPLQPLYVPHKFRK